MKKSSRLLAIGFILVVFAISLFDSKTLLQGANDGIALCLKAIVPGLFPFIFLVIYLSGLLSSCSGFRFPFLTKLLRIPEGAERLFLLGLISGYPIGSKTIYESFRTGSISKYDAKRMLGFCSNAGPSFIFGILAPFFPSVAVLWLLWGIHILSAVIAAILLPGQSVSECTSSTSSTVSITEALEKSLKTTAIICGWVVLFRIVNTFLISYLHPSNSIFKVLLLGLPELTNGCVTLDEITDLRLRMVICSGMLTLGGCCVLLQTASVTKDLGLGYYIPGKLLQCCISVLLSSLLVFPKIDILLTAFVGIIAITCLLHQNNSRKLQTHGV